MDKFEIHNKENIHRSQQVTRDLADSYSATETNQKPSNLPSKVKNKGKAQKKSNGNSVRAGDWICLLCNNLNFSFRAECNRCGLQTKKQNHLQNFQLMSDNTTTSTERQPLKDVTNIHHLTRDESPHSGDKSSKSGSLDAPPGLGFADLLDVQITEPNKPKTLRNPSNFGFESALLITPPRIGLAEEESTNKKSGSNNKFFPPYKSPDQQLPSISPLLRRVFGAETSGSNDLTIQAPETRLSFKRNLSYVEEEAIEISPHFKSGESTDLNDVNYFQEIENFLQKEEETNEKEKTKLSPINSIQEQNNIMLPHEYLLNPPTRKTISLPFIEDYGYDHKPRHPINSQLNSKKGKKSDWICSKCKNLNYSFRKVCNRCHANK